MRINIEIGDIEAFIELTETNSFAKAANNLNLSQPALSRRIQKLEHELGTTLFDRTTRKVQLSYSGRNFYDRARGIIEAVKTATKTLNEKYSFPSIIKIGVVHSALRNILFSALKSFKEIEDNKIFEFIFINIVIYYKNYYLFSKVYQHLTT